jgi:predicted MPP superfamily phosphohydrolase
MLWLRKSVELGALLITILTCKCGLNTYQIEITHTEIGLPNLPAALDGYRIGLISCLHTTSFGPRERLLRRRLEDLDVDILIIAGDFCKKGTRRRDTLDAARQIFSGLNFPDGMLATRGNHDGPDLADPLREMGVLMLNDEIHAFRHGDAALTFLGVGTALRRDPPWAAVLHRARGIPGPRIGICHSPDGVVSASRHPIDLVLSGHTHGGQIVLPFVGPLVTSTRLVGLDFASGLCHYDGTPVYVNRGIGWTALPLRLNCPPEISVLTLRRPGGAGREHKTPP